LSKFRIFSLEELSNEGLLRDHCFINYLKYFNVNLDSFEIAADIIRDVHPLKYLNTICNTLEITCIVSYADETVKYQSPK
jgi:hypothetical protein